jgi:sugar O-acyltransferase (sialic acid O-acetyltransferase NeuD family)
MKEIIIFGTTEIAKLAYFYISRDKAAKVIAFAADKAYVTTPIFCDLPVIDTESMKEKYPPSKIEIFVAIGPSVMNTRREKKFKELSEIGYSFYSYISKNAVCDSPVGKNCLVGDGAVVNPFVKIGDNTFIWEQTLISSDAILGNHCYLAPKSTVSSYCEVGDFCTLGSASVLKARIRLAEKTLVGAACYISKDSEPMGVYGIKSAAFLGAISEKVDISL